MQYLTVHDIVILDKSCLNHNFRRKLMEIFNGIILIGTIDEDISKYFHWLIQKNIFMKYIYIKHNSNLLLSIQNNVFMKFVQYVYLDNIKFINCDRNRCYRRCLKYNKNQIINVKCFDKCLLNNNIVIKVNDWKSLISLQLMDCSLINDDNLKQITKNCFSLLHVSLCNGMSLTNDSLKYIVDNNNKLHSLKLYYLPLITDEIIILILNKSYSTINSLIFDSCPNITNNCIQYISLNCFKLQSLEIIHSMYISSTFLLKLINNSNIIESLIIINCKNIKVDDIKFLAHLCFNLKTYFLKFQYNIISKDFNEGKVVLFL
jgi:hypothetical protein